MCIVEEASGSKRQLYYDSIHLNALYNGACDITHEIEFDLTFIGRSMPPRLGLRCIRGTKAPTGPAARPQPRTSHAPSARACAAPLHLRVHRRRLKMTTRTQTYTRRRTTTFRGASTTYTRTYTSKYTSRYTSYPHVTETEYYPYTETQTQTEYYPETEYPSSPSNNSPPSSAYIAIG